MDAEAFRRLFAHAAWANARLQAALEECASPPAKALELHAHVLGAELVWLERIHGVPQDSPAEVWPAAEVEACAGLVERAREAYASFGSELDAQALQRDVHYSNSAGDAFVTPLPEVLLHVALHGSYHRGQVARLLSVEEDVACPTDFIAFVRGAPAATRRPG